MRVLYSAIGTTDPVRGLRDGGLMHIMRHYRPDVVCLFLSAEMVRRDREDDRVNKTFAHIRENWGGYDPQLVRFETDIEDPSDLDALAGPMEALLDQIIRDYPGAEVLMNLSSGTPQMEILIVQMSQDPRRRNIRGIQVKNPERRSGTTQRTNTRNYPIDEALGLNEDEEPGQENRCVEPNLLAVRRDTVRKQLEKMVAQRNYAAIADMGADLPAPWPQLARHLDYRSRFLLSKAEEAAKGLSFKGVQLHSKMPDLQDWKQKRDYPLVEMVEYFSMLKHLVYLERYTEFALRLNPFVIQLQLTLLDRQGKSGLLTGSKTRRKVTPSHIAQQDPALLEALTDKFGSVTEEKDVSIPALNVMLGHYGLAPEAVTLLDRCELVNSELRNPAAHTFKPITNEHIRTVCGMTAQQLVRGLEELLLEAAESCRSWGLEQRLNVYANCDKLLLECL